MKAIPVEYIIILSNFLWDIRLQPDTIIQGDPVIENVIKKKKEIVPNIGWQTGIERRKYIYIRLARLRNKRRLLAFLESFLSALQKRIDESKI